MTHYIYASIIDCKNIITYYKTLKFILSNRCLIIKKKATTAIKNLSTNLHLPILNSKNQNIKDNINITTIMHT